METHSPENLRVIPDAQNYCSVKKMDILTNFKLLAAESKEFYEMTSKEISDFNKLSSEHEDSQLMRRLKIRVIFSCIEAYLSHLKAGALTLTIDNLDFFSPEEQFELRDQKKRKDGKIVAQRFTIKENIKIAFNAFSKATEHKVSLSFGDEEGKDFLESVEVRNRITHPRSAKDWNITDYEISMVDKAWIWFGKRLVQVSAADWK